MKIINIDTNMSSVEKGMGDRYLVLDQKPSYDWIQFFEQAHKEYFSMSKRRAKIQGQYLVVNCPLDEIQNQINQLQEQLATATRDYNAYVVQKNQDFKAQEAALKQKKNDAEDIFKNLDF
ncbi:hypothetical protein AB6T09_10900 [Serratia marcescens]